MRSRVVAETTKGLKPNRGTSAGLCWFWGIDGPVGKKSSLSTDGSAEERLDTGLSFPNKRVREPESVFVQTRDHRKLLRFSSRCFSVKREILPLNKVSVVEGFCVLAKISSPRLNLGSSLVD